MTLLAGVLFDLDLWAVIWPYFVIAPGILCLAVGLATVHGYVGHTAFGAMLVVTGLLLFYQNIFDYFQSRAYAWALVVLTAIGIGAALHGRIYRDATLLRWGARLTMIGLILFLIFAVCFEVGVYQHGSSVKVGGAGLLVLLGISLALGSLARLATSRGIARY